ncbi:MAG TPA: VWA domain-containing protein [Candidatus Acidoferrum sp.]|nr:VWA domain-containing protein [Candidatus Acidoferrum sp.]
MRSPRVHHPVSYFRAFLRAIVFCLGPVLLIYSQEPSPAPVQQTEPEVIRKQSNLVMLRVIVRDVQGRSIEGLTKADFQVFDNKMPQVISKFSVDTPLPEDKANKTSTGEKPAEAGNARPATALRFTVLFFDDYHLQFADLVQLREAAKRFLQTRLEAGERVAIVTASGQGTCDFSVERDKFDQALSRLQFNSRFQKFAPCPNLTTYQAQLIDDGLDRDALEVGVQLTILCLCHGGTLPCPDPELYTKNQARQIVIAQEVGAENTLTVLENVVKRLEAMPGERRIAMISDGFLSKNRQYRLDTVVDRALRANVIINTLDARGLYVVNPGGDASTPGMQLRSDLRTIYFNIEATGKQVDADVLNYAAEGTGGIFVQNTNDFEGGLARITSLHETCYVLGFVPANLKYDGRFHTLTVKLASGGHYTLQARRGYFAPRQAEDAAATLKEEMEQAVFSRENLTELPIEVQTQFFKADPETAKLSVVVRSDIRGLRFRKENGRNLDDLTLLVAVFDQDGNYITSEQQTANLHFSEPVLEQVMNAGLPLTVKFDLKPGNYLVRAVVRDSNSQKLGATSRNLGIP